VSVVLGGTVWMDGPTQPAFTQTRPRRWWQLGLLPDPAPAAVAVEPVMLAVEDAAKAGHEGLLGMVVKHTADGQHMDVFSTDIVAELIEFKWQRYGRARFLHETAAHAALLLAWTYVTIREASTTEPTFGSLGTEPAVMAAVLSVTAAGTVGVATRCHIRRHRWMASSLIAAMMLVASALLCISGDGDWSIAGAVVLVISLSTRSLIQEARQLADVVPTVEDFDKDYCRPHTAPPGKAAEERSPEEEIDTTSNAEFEPIGDEDVADDGNSTPSTSWRDCCRARVCSSCSCSCCRHHCTEGYIPPGDTIATSSAEAAGAVKQGAEGDSRGRALSLAREYETLLTTHGDEAADAIGPTQRESVRRRVQVRARY
jgi:hypothetical protein